MGHERRPIKIYIYIFLREVKRKGREENLRGRNGLWKQKRGSRQLVTIQKGGLGKYEGGNKW